MSEMVERVANAIAPKCIGTGELRMQVAREIARAAIDAMREPTEAMKIASHGPRGASNEIEDRWERMIDAALKCDD